VPELAAELVQGRAAVIVTTGGSSTLGGQGGELDNSARFFLSQDDPVKLGLVASFNQPGGLGAQCDERSAPNEVKAAD
jgi:hypothetical protein